MRDWSDAEDQVDEIIRAMRAKGKLIPQTLGEIPDFPYVDFNHMVDDLMNNRMLIQKFSFRYESDISSIFASKLENLRLSTYPALMILLPLVGIVLGLLHSWWWLLLVPLGLSLRGRFKKIYERVIFRPAIQSEKLFCFLYYVRQVLLVPPDYSESIYWGKGEE